MMMPIARVWKVSDKNKASKIEEIMEDTRFSTLDAISSQLPNGIYSTFRTYNHNHSLLLESHFHRLIESANIIHKPINLDFSIIREAIRAVVRLSTEKELRIRLTINPDKFPAEIFISIEPLKTPTSEDYDKGVFTVLHKGARDNPKAKTTSFLKSAELIRSDMNGDINEVLMVNSKDQILEGLSSNFFAVIGGEIWTESDQVLSGFVRAAILELAVENGIRVHPFAILTSDINRLHEAFLTSTSRSVLPIQRINSSIINNGEPGYITKKLIKLYQHYIRMSLEEI